MLIKLKNLVFGLEEYEKTKLEDRFEILKLDLNNVTINSLEDFECVEDCISKINDLLRLKSSNLSKSINNPSKKITKKDVSQVLYLFDKIKYDFLKIAFKKINIENIVSNSIDDNIPEEKTENKYEIENLKNLLVEENENYKIHINNGKVAHILVEFKNDYVDMSFINKLSSYFFEIIGAQGTNILIEKNRALIIPRNEGDNLISLPRVEIDIESIYSKLLDSLNLKNKGKEENNQVKTKDEKVDLNSESKIGEQNIKDTDEGYLFAKKKNEYSTKNDSSLDDLLKKDFEKEILHPKPKDDNSKIEIFKDDKIIFEKKDKSNEIEFEIEKNKPDEEIISNSKTKDEKIINDDNIEHKFLIYKDDKIVIYFEENSKVLGELKLKTVNSKKLNELDEADLSYIMMFAKAFSAYLFDALEAHGSNTLFNYNQNFISILPRYKEDNLDIMWKPKQESDDFLRDIQKKLISYMHKDHNDIKKDDLNMSIKNIENEIIDDKSNDKKYEKKDLESTNNPKEIKLDNSNKKEKAQYILDYLNKIP